MIQHACVQSYSKLKNLKLVGDELGIAWQTVYVHLRRAGVPVTGDKARYGSAKDRLASYAERLFSKDVPSAIDSNQKQFQSAIDFAVGRFTVDVKASTLHPSRAETSGKITAPRWMFSINKQKDKADFFVMYALDQFEARGVVHVFLMPSEIATTASTIVIPESMNSKWADYKIERADLDPFFTSI